MDKYRNGLIATVFLLAFLTGCQSGKSVEEEKSADNEAIGTVYKIHEENMRIEVDIHAWGVKEGHWDEDSDIQAHRIIDFTSETVSEFEDGRAAAFEDFHEGQKVKLFEGDGWHEFENKIILLEEE